MSSGGGPLIGHTHTSVIGAMGLRGLVAALTVEGAVDAEVFNA